jgi:D-threo-aldose 1-dehydrogenase
LARAKADGAGLLNAAVLGGGALTDPARVTGKYGYNPASAQTLAAIEEMRAVCREFGTDLATAATRFSTRDPQFASTIIGISKPSRIASTIAAANGELPDELFDRLEGLLPSAENWLDNKG